MKQKLLSFAMFNIAGLWSVVTCLVGGMVML